MLGGPAGDGGEQNAEQSKQHAGSRFLGTLRKAQGERKMLAGVRTRTAHAELVEAWNGFRVGFTAAGRTTTSRSKLCRLCRERRGARLVPCVSDVLER